MNKNYKNIVTLTLFTLLSALGFSQAQAAALHKDGYSVWGKTTAGLTQAEYDYANSFLQAWNNKEPNNGNKSDNQSGSEHCALQTPAGGWEDWPCTETRYAACFNGLNSWARSTNSLADPRVNTVLCPAGYVFAAPVTPEQQAALKGISNMPSNGIWVNAFDNTVAGGGNPEGKWKYNLLTQAVIMPNWASGQPSSANTNQCGRLHNDGTWSSADCSGSAPALCANADFSQFDLTPNDIVYSSEKALQQACRQTFGAAWSFVAPKNITQNNSARTAMGISNKSVVWINANNHKFANFWELNTEVANWATGEPNFGTDNEKQCAVARQSDGKWEMAKCDANAYILCSDGTNWKVRTATHQFTNQAFEACGRKEAADGSSNPFLNYALKTPVTELDFSRAYTALRAAPNGTKAWLNLKHISDTGAWLINENYENQTTKGRNPGVRVWYHVMEDGNNDKEYGGPWYDYFSAPQGAVIDKATAKSHNMSVPNYFAHKEPNGSDDSSRKSCVQMSAIDQSWGKAGQWDDTSCTNSKRFACYDGFEWAVSPSENSLGTDVDTAENISNGHNACAAIEKNGATGSFRFAAPTSFKESMELAATASAIGVNQLWINVHSKKYKRTFVMNLGARVQAPFWNAGEPNNAGSGEDCAVQQKNAALAVGWNDLPCSSAQPVACYNPNLGANGTWKVTAANHVFTSVAAFNVQCETEFGSQYKFYAPTTLSQQADLKAVMVDDNAYINANDSEYEGSWQINLGVNNWAVGQPSSLNSELCVSAKASTSFWSSRACTETLPVACSSGTGWYFTTEQVNLSQYANAEKLCQKEFGAGYFFAAPRTLDDALQLQYSAKLAGIGGDFWINGNRIADFNTWVWNANQLSTPVWGYNGQPNGGKAENCAVLNNNSEGSWDDEGCASGSYAYLCRNGNQWQVTGSGTLADFATAVTACTALGNGWVFAAPTTYNENLAAKNAMAGHAKVWVNATDAITEGDWLLNAAPIDTYPLWGNTNSGSCLFQDDQGKVNSTDCSSTGETAPWACNNGYTWKVTKSEGLISKFAEGHKACLREYGSNYMFAAPLSMNDAIQLDFARLQAAHDRNSPINRIWLNMTTAAASPFTSHNGVSYRRNLPFANWRDFNAGEEPLPTSCAYKSSAAEGMNNPWLEASCSGFAAHYACTDGDTWKVALSKGKLEGEQVQLTPQVGQDYWSYERGNALCKEQYGASYYFSAPISAAEELALDAAIRRSPANVKNVWINYYAISALAGQFLSEYATGEINRGDGLWFANRLKLGTWQKPNFNNFNNANCALLHSDGSLTDTSCSNDSRLDFNKTTYPFACFNGVAWTVVGNGYWEDGFAACETASNTMFGIPRTPDELDDLKVVMTAAGHNKIWVNLNDTAQEGQWIANRLRYSWWAAGEPSNTFNKDCAQINHSTGQWFAARCSLEIASFACRSTTSGSTGSSIRWDVTEAKGYWAEGFGACAKEFPGSQFVAPQGFGTLSGSEDQANLAAVVARPDNGTPRNAWLNLSDQESEGAWRGYHAYSNWGVNSLFDQNRDCGYIDIAVPVQPGKGNWFADSCKYTAGSAVSRGYSCTNGSVWQIASTTATTDMRWSSGFAACEALGSGWYFAAPTTGMHNTQLQNAMKDKGITQLWINAHDRINEGDWLINGSETNFPPEADVSATAAVVNENTASIMLHAALSDDEEQGIDAANTKWELVSNRSVNAAENTPNLTDITVSSSVVTATSHGGATVTATYSTPVLLKEDRLLTFKLTAKDIGTQGNTNNAATSETYVNVRVRAPLLAAWDFEEVSRPHRDITGHGHDILVSTMNSANVISEVTNGQANRAVQLRPDSLLKVNGTAADAANGLHFDSAAYTLALRISVETAATGTWRGIVQKGDDGMERQPAIFLFDGSNHLHSTNSTNQSNNRAINSANEMLPQQWLNLIYVKTANNFKVYVDGALIDSYDFAAGEIAQGNTGSFYIGNIPGAGESMTGLIDDIYVFNRELTPAEITEVLPAKPLGTVQFKEASATVDEANTTAPHQYNIELERTRGNAEALTVYVDHIGGSALKGTVADMDTASNPADFALTHEANYVAGKGIPVTWAAGERGVKTLTLTLDKADDGIREGTETAQFKITDFAGANEGVNKNFTLYLTDITPNPYGAFSVGIKRGSNYLTEAAVNETDNTPQQICFVRDIGTASAAIGDVEVHYSVSGSAVLDTHYEISGVLALGDPVIFNDGDSLKPLEKCITVAAKPDAVEANHNLRVTINSVSAVDSVVESEIMLAAGLTSANLEIQDYNPGVFGFTASQFRCYENATTIEMDAANVVSWARPLSSSCVVTVKRSGTGVTAPATDITLSLIGDSSYSLVDTYTLHWDELTAGATSSSEEQSISLTIDHDNKQNSDAIYMLTLEPIKRADNSMPQIDLAGISSASMRIQDVTGPAVVVVSSSAANINEGADSTFTIARAGGNADTYFDIDYQVIVENAVTNVVVANPEHYISSPLTGTLSFAQTDTSKTFTLNTIDTIENNANIKVNFNLQNPRRPNSDNRPSDLARDDVIGLGTVLAAGTGANNKIGANVQVNNTRDLIADNMTIVVRDLGGDTAARPVQTFNAASGSIVSAGNFLAVKKVQVPDTRELELEIQLPAGKHIDDATYSWSLLSSDGTTEAQWDDGVTPVANTNGNTRITNRSGSLGYESTGLNKTNALSVKAKVKLPFVTGVTGNVDPQYGWGVAQSPFKLKLNITGNSESFSKEIALTVEPVYRRLQNRNNDRCVRAYANGGDTLVGCAASKQWSDIYWTWNPETKYLINLKEHAKNSANKCIDIAATSGLGTTKATLKACSPTAEATGNRKATFNTDGYFMIDGTTTCRYALDNSAIMRKSGCSDNNDRKWSWLD